MRGPMRGIFAAAAHQKKYKKQQHIYIYLLDKIKK